MTEEADTTKKIENEERDEELDVAIAAEKARDFMKKIIPNLINAQFRLEFIRQNGEKTRYNVVCSIVPDLGAERDYYSIKIDVKTGKIVQPIRRGKLIGDTIKFQNINIPDEWVE